MSVITRIDLWLDEICWSKAQETCPSQLPGRAAGLHLEHSVFSALASVLLHFPSPKKRTETFHTTEKLKGFSVCFLRISLSLSLMELNFIYKHWVWLAGVVAGFLFLGMDLC